jgi:hypothetical protein
MNKEDLKKIWNISADDYSYIEDIWRKTGEDNWRKTDWRKTDIETDEEKLEKMDFGTIEKFLRKKKLEQLAKNKR